MIDEKDLEFDRTRHVCYSKKTKGIVLDFVKAKLPEDEVDEAFEKMQLKYCEYLKDQPYLGGKKCFHNREGGTYDCFLMFACYDVLTNDLGVEMTVEEVEHVCNSVFLPSFESLGKIFNINTPWVMKLMQTIFKYVEKKDKKMLEAAPDGYITIVEPYEKELGIRYRFDQCPIAEFAKRHDFVDIMPGFCNGDFPAMELIHGKLIRKHTCSNSDVCDYWIVGDKSPYAREHPTKKGSDGYLYSE